MLYRLLLARFRKEGKVSTMRECIIIIYRHLNARIATESDCAVSNPTGGSSHAATGRTYSANYRGRHIAKRWQFYDGLWKH